VAKARGLSREEAEARWLDESLAEIRSYMGNSQSLSAFMKELADKGTLSKANRITLVEQALILLEMNYVHLPQKRAMHGTDPVLRLKRLRFQLEEMNEDELPGEMRFHSHMQEIFRSARDIHTNYTLPAPFKNMTAFLPFLVEEYFDRRDTVPRQSASFDKTRLAEAMRTERTPRFLVSHVAKGFRHPTFYRGVEVLYWNGVPIKRAIELNGERQASSNLDARFAHGLDSLTIRPFNGSLPPEEMWVVVTYRTERGKQEEVKLEWRVFQSKPMPRERKAPAAGRRIAKVDRKIATNVEKNAINAHKDAINRVRKLWLAPRARKTERKKADGDLIATIMQHTFNARCVRTPSGNFGYVRIFTFAIEFEDEIDPFVNEFARLIKLLPQNGLIIDVRGNGGGEIRAAERLLQLLTPARIKPTLFQVINTPLNLDICRVLGWSDWAESISESAVTGAIHSRGFPITSEKACNDIGRVYYGPVLLITDALCYSATDIFAASFQDHEVGEILGTSGNTGAGGANVLTQKSLTEWMSKHPGQSPFKPLPKGVSMRVAFRRSIRSGKHLGRPLEELGVVPDRRYYMTRDDLLRGNPDLIDAAAELLAQALLNVGQGIAGRSDGRMTLVVTTKYITRLEIHINGRLQRSRDLVDGRSELVVNVPAKRKAELVLKGFKGNSLLVEWRKRLP
jgi:C-terminal processing protease CtpA/Prc